MEATEIVDVKQRENNRVLGGSAASAACNIPNNAVNLSNYLLNICGHFPDWSHFSSPLLGSEEYYTTRKISARIICKTIE